MQDSMDGAVIARTVDGKTRSNVSGHVLIREEGTAREGWWQTAVCFSRMIEGLADKYSDFFVLHRRGIYGEDPRDYDVFHMPWSDRRRAWYLEAPMVMPLDEEGLKCCYIDCLTGHPERLISQLGYDYPLGEREHEVELTEEGGLILEWLLSRHTDFAEVVDERSIDAALAASGVRDHVPTPDENGAYDGFYEAYLASGKPYALVAFIGNVKEYRFEVVKGSDDYESLYEYAMGRFSNGQPDIASEVFLRTEGGGVTIMHYGVMQPWNPEHRINES